MIITGLLGDPIKRRKESGILKVHLVESSQHELFDKLGMQIIHVLFHVLGPHVADIKVE
jgi:hypothetical protein